MTAWHLQICRVTDALAQELVGAVLEGLPDVSVERVSSDFDHFVVTEVQGGRQSDELFQFMRTIDPGVTLIHSSGPQEATPQSA